MTARLMREEPLIEGTSRELAEHRSTLPFDATLERLRLAITSAGMAIFAEIDHAAGARGVGMQMPPTVVLIYGSARGGTPVMLEKPAAALDLPLRVLVRESADRRTYVSFRPVCAMLLAIGVSEPVAARLEPAQRLLVEAIGEGNL